MDSRTASFLIAAVILIAIRFVMFAARRRGRPFLEVVDVSVRGWSPRQLLLASFLTLFAELAFIRWIAVEIWVFAYFKNLALLLCFVGFGLGCALAAERTRWSTAITAYLGLLLVVRLPWADTSLDNLSRGLGGAPDVSIWEAGSIWHWTSFLPAALLAGALFVLIVMIFVPLGQVVSGQMNRCSRTLQAYSWNLFGSLLGVVAFFVISQLMLPPSVWLGIVLLGIALLQGSRRDAGLVASLVVPLALLLYTPQAADQRILWTPYQQIQYTRRYTEEGDSWGGTMLVNHKFYQRIENLSTTFLSRHPNLLAEPPDENPYNVPFRFTVPDPKVLVVGSGTGNDIAGALRHDSRTVDAVEIDPAILELGKREHPEHPYDSPRVSIHLTDARSFLKRSTQQYDLILFGLLDSHAQFSDYSNMRIDNFVYTHESFREAKRLLSPEGLMVVKFAIERRWMATRLAEMLRETFGKEPLIFVARSSLSVRTTCFVISKGNRVEEALAADPRLERFVRANTVRLEGKLVPVTTDDWPYLYQEGRWIPRTYYSVGVLVMLIAIGLYLQIGDAQRRPSLFFFSMGAGFLLLETQVISRLALFFGTIWQVNGIVISALLIALLIANWIVEHSDKSPSRLWIWAGLIAGLGFAYGFPFDRIGSPTMGGVIAVVVFSVPVMFAGIMFSSEFKVAESPSAALGANMLGAVAGGLLENLSLLFGMHALLLVAIAVYVVAGLALWRRNQTRQATLATTVSSFLS